MEKQVAIEITKLTVRMYMVKTGLVFCNPQELMRLSQFELDEWIAANRYCREHRLGMSISTSDLAELYLRIKDEYFFSIDDAVNIARSSAEVDPDNSTLHAVQLDQHGKASLVKMDSAGAVIMQTFEAASFSQLVTDFECIANQHHFSEVIN